MDDSPGRPDPLQFIRAKLPPLAVPSIPEIRLHTANPSSGLWRLVESEGEGSAASPPYWAYPWAGGLALARHLLDTPGIVAGRRVLDLGAGSGLVGIAAAKAGARSVVSADTDRHAVVALGLNAALNGVELGVVADDMVDGPPPAVDLVAVGDLFYERDLAVRVTGFLDRCVAAGIAVLVGDPGRAWLPVSRLRLQAEYPALDFGEARDAADRTAGVFSFEPPS